MADIQFAPNSEAEGQLDIRIVDNNGSPVSVLEASQPFTIQASWRYQNGGNPPFAGDWIFRAFAESIGPGPESEIALQNAPVRQSSGAFQNTANLVVPGNSLPNQPAPPVSGVYRILVLMTHSLDPNLAAFEERLLRVA
jgi:hypothetical protein